MYRVIRIEEGDLEVQEAFCETLEEAEEIAHLGSVDYECEHRVVDRYGDVISWWGAGA